MASCSRSRPAREVGSALALSETRRLVAPARQDLCCAGASSLPVVRRRRYWRRGGPTPLRRLWEVRAVSAFADVDGMLC